MHVVRWVGFAVAATAALVSFIVLRPEAPELVGPTSIEGVGEMVQQAINDYDVATVAAGDDPQLQIVANGWIARDLLFVLASELQLLADQGTILSTQLDTLATTSEPDDRVPVLVLIGVLTLAFHAATLPLVGDRGPVFVTDEDE